jgi:hypothetical protein
MSAVAGFVGRAAGHVMADQKQSGRQRRMLLYGITYMFWKYLRDIRRIHKKFTPPFIKYRTGKS